MLPFKVSHGIIKLNDHEYKMQGRGSIMSINPIKLIGNWDEGYALDRHTVSSIPVGEDVYGHMQFHTVRSNMGELLFHFKYRNKHDSLDEIIQLAKPFVLNWRALKTVSAVIPAPSSNMNRMYQPAYEIAREIAELLDVRYFDNVLKKDTTICAKNLSGEQKHQINGSIIKLQEAKCPHNMLIVDDLYESGSTLRECVNVLRTDKNIKHIYVLTMTKTRG